MRHTMVQALAARRRVVIGFAVLSGLPVCVGASSGFGAPAQHGTAAMSLECQIRAEPANGYLRLQAIARSNEQVSGRYRLLVSKNSASGSSQNVQSGSFNLTSGRERVLSTVVLDGSAIGHYHAQLSLDSDQGRVSCSSP
ncbi:MAG TPA: curli-like amyloid fiber formation chaperone CsgH [Pseudolabrys sp.]|jgi:hypothetical protein|nr:curli-like amyloid fiber formation chaperone CsgH [Pseudolabrys sp.]